MDDLHLALNPLTPPEELQRIAAADASLRSVVALHPAAYPALLEWLGSLGDPAVDAALRQRTAPDAGAVPLPPTPMSRPSLADLPPPELPAPELPAPDLQEFPASGSAPSSAGPADVPPEPAPRPPGSRPRWLVPVVATVGVLAVAAGAFALPAVLGDDDGDPTAAGVGESVDPEPVDPDAGGTADPAASTEPESPATQKPDPAAGTEKPTAEAPPPPLTFADGGHVGWQVRAADLVPARPELGDANFAWWYDVGGQINAFHMEPLDVGKALVAPVQYTNPMFETAETMMLVGIDKATGSALWQQEVPSTTTCGAAGEAFACLEGSVVRVRDAGTGAVITEAMSDVTDGELWAGEGGGLLVASPGTDWMSLTYEVYSDAGERLGGAVVPLASEVDPSYDLFHHRVVVGGSPQRAYDANGVLLAEAEDGLLPRADGSILVGGNGQYTDLGVVPVVPLAATWASEVRTSEGSVFLDTNGDSVARVDPQAGEQWRVPLNDLGWAMPLPTTVTTSDGTEVLGIPHGGVITLLGLDGTWVGEVLMPEGISGDPTNGVVVSAGFGAGAPVHGTSLVVGGEIWQLAAEGMQAHSFFDDVVILTNPIGEPSYVFHTITAVLPGLP